MFVKYQIHPSFRHSCGSNYAYILDGIRNRCTYTSTTAMLRFDLLRSNARAALGNVSGWNSLYFFHQRIRKERILKCNIHRCLSLDILIHCYASSISTGCWSHSSDFSLPYSYGHSSMPYVTFRRK